MRTLRRLPGTQSLTLRVKEPSEEEVALAAASGRRAVAQATGFPSLLPYEEQPSAQDGGGQCDKDSEAYIAAASAAHQASQQASSQAKQAPPSQPQLQRWAIQVVDKLEELEELSHN